MTQLTPVFKLMLLVSLGLHLVAIIESGYFSPGHHQQNLDTRLNITLSQSAEPKPEADATPEKVSRKKAETQPAKPSPNPDPATKIEPDEVRQKEPVKPYREPLPQQNEQQRQKLGDTRSGVAVEESYKTRLLRHLEQYKHYPFIARRRQLEGQVSIRIELKTDGRLLNIECLSGNDLFCEAAIHAAREAQPFPQPPASLSGKAFEYAMEYKLR